MSLDKAKSTDPGLSTETDVVTTVNKDDRRTGFITSQGTVATDGTYAVAPGYVAHLTGLHYTNGGTATTYTIQIGSNTLMDGIIPAVSSAGFIPLQPEVLEGADGEDVTLALTNGTGTGYLVGYLT